MTANVETSEPKETKAKAKAKATEGEFGKTEGGLKSEGGSVAAGGALRTLDRDTSAINLSV